jgi:dihydroflavonol-4-reductase
MRLLLTGANGFLGRRCKEALLSWGHELVVIEGRSDFTAKIQEILQSKIYFDTIFHCGFSVDFSPISAKDSENVRSAELIAQVMEKHAKKLIFISAAGVHGVGASAISRAEADFGKSDYSAYLQTQYIQDKLQAEKIFEPLAERTIILYPSTIYGKGMPEASLNALMPGPIVFFPPGGTSFLAIEDFLSALKKCIQPEISGAKLILNGGNLSFEELFRTAQKIRKRRSIYVRLPQFTKNVIALLPQRSKLLSPAVLTSGFGYKYYSAARAEKLLDWQANTELTTSLRALFD